MANNGKIIVLGEKTQGKLRCPYNCDGGDVTVNPETGECSVCHRIYEIEMAEIKVENVFVATN